MTSASIDLQESGLVQVAVGAASGDDAVQYVLHQPGSSTQV